MISEGKKNILKIASDLIFSIGGLVAMNGVLQLFLYPKIEKTIGAAANDNVLTLLSVVSILATMFGTSANYSRMVAKTHGRSNNGDYNFFLLLTFPIAAVVSALGVRLVTGKWNILSCILLSILSIFSILRYYGDVEFRLNVNYKKFSFYYVLIAIGYFAGTFLVWKNVFGNDYSWLAAFIIREAIAVAYVFLRGEIFRGKDVIKPQETFNENLKSIMFLLGTNFINAFVLKSDTIFIKAFVGEGGTVTTFYVATLIGKIVALLTTPLNGVIIGYLTKYEGRFSKRFFATAVGIALGVGALFTLCCWPVSHVFVKIMYDAEVYNAAKPYFLLANAGQVLYFISGSMMVVVLRFIHERWQLIINIIYAVLYAAIVIPILIKFGLWGITYGLLIVNALRFLMVVILGFFKIRRNEIEKT